MHHAVMWLSLILSISNRIENREYRSPIVRVQFAQLCSVIHVACRLLGAAVEKAVVDEVEHGGEQRQRAAGDRRPERPVEVHVGRRQPINVQRQLGLGVVARPRAATEHRHRGRLDADCHRTP